MILTAAATQTKAEAGFEAASSSTIALTSAAAALLLPNRESGVISASATSAAPRAKVK